MDSSALFICLSRVHDLVPPSSTDEECSKKELSTRGGRSFSIFSCLCKLLLDAFAQTCYGSCLLVSPPHLPSHPLVGATIFSLERHTIMRFLSSRRMPCYSVRVGECEWLP